jgi:cytochrome c oxidase subunit 2
MCNDNASSICRAGSKKRTGLTCCLPALAPALCGCSGVQSALDPQGPAAAALAQLTWVMIFGAAAIFALVMFVACYAVYRDPDKRRRVSPTSIIVAGGVAFPVVVLSALLAYGVALTGTLRAADENDALHIRVTGHQFWWEVLYPGASAGEFVASANEIRIPVGRSVALALTSRDVVHSLWVPNLAGKVDLIPGRVTRLALRAERTGTFRGQCAEFCGADHARMALHVVALAQDEFERWLANLRSPARAPGSERLRAGRDAFVAQGCANCHAVRGVTQPQIRAPDLTHLAGREWIGAGTFRNTREHLIEWIARGDAVKPGRAMPSYAHLDAATLASIADYLDSLE